jgi:hypothetical protein
MARPQSKVLSAAEGKALKQTLKTESGIQTTAKTGAEKAIKAAKKAHDDAVKAAKKDLKAAADKSDAACKEAAKTLAGIEKAQAKVIAAADKALVKVNANLAALAPMPVPVLEGATA